MGLFSRRKRQDLVSPDELPPLPPQVSLQSFLPTSGGEYIAKDSFSGHDKDTFREVRLMAAEAFKQLGVDRGSDARDYQGVVIRSPHDPSAIWVSVEGVVVDRLLTSATASFPADWVGPSLVSVRLAHWQSSGLRSVEVWPYEPTRER